MSTRILVGLAAAVALAVVLFLVLRPGGDDDEEANPTPATETSATTTEATEETTSEETTEETTTEAAPPPAERIRVRFANEQVVGGVKQVEIERGRDVVLTVRSDVADEVHVHGYDLSTEVAPGEPSRISFTADLVGRFEVELEERTIPLVDLEVHE